MRRKDLSYYLNTLHLRYKALQLKRERKAEKYKEWVEKNREDLLFRWRNTELQFKPFQAYFHPYFKLNSSIFNQEYSAPQGFPISLKNGEINPLFPLFYILIRQNEGQWTEEEAIQIYEWLLSYQPQEAHQWLLPYRFDYPLFEQEAPWISGITQSLLVCFLLRLHHHSGKEKYVEDARRAFHPCKTPLFKKGVLTATSAGKEWVEEYPAKPANHVLNGHVFAIIAAMEMYQSTQEKQYAIHTEQWLESLIYHLPEYQYEHYFIHNKKQWKLSNIEYQGLYVGLFKQLHEMTDHPLFTDLYRYYEYRMDWKKWSRFYNIESK